VLLAGLIIKLSTPAGMVILEVDQPELIGAVVTIDGEKKITIKTGKGKEPIEISPMKSGTNLKSQSTDWQRCCVLRAPKPIPVWLLQRTVEISTNTGLQSSQHQNLLQSQSTPRNVHQLETRLMQRQHQ
jgi:hypothetical protein